MFKKDRHGKNTNYLIVNPKYGTYQFRCWSQKYDCCKEGKTEPDVTSDILDHIREYRIQTFCPSFHKSEDFNNVCEINVYFSGMFESSNLLSIRLSTRLRYIPRLFICTSFNFMFTKSGKCLNLVVVTKSLVFFVYKYVLFVSILKY